MRKVHDDLNEKFSCSSNINEESSQFEEQTPSSTSNLIEKDEKKVSSSSNSSMDSMNINSLSYIQTKQRRIDHRRNKSEPLIRSNLDDEQENLSTRNCQTILESSSTSTTSNDSSLSHSSTHYHKKSSNDQIHSPSNHFKDKSSNSSSATKKKKSWYNVSISLRMIDSDKYSSFFAPVSKLFHSKKKKKRRRARERPSKERTKKRKTKCH